eukprot:2475040-Rhodomonas_salina.4
MTHVRTTLLTTIFCMLLHGATSFGPSALAPSILDSCRGHPSAAFQSLMLGKPDELARRSGSGLTTLSAVSCHHRFKDMLEQDRAVSLTVLYCVLCENRFWRLRQCRGSHSESLVCNSQNLLSLFRSCQAWNKRVQQWHCSTLQNSAGSHTHFPQNPLHQIWY